jgi:para-nitrobenzyl esterase
MGANLGELTVPAWIWMPWVIPGYIRLFSGASKAGGKPYGYIFDRVPAGWKRKGITCNHGRELAYVFGNLDPKSESWNMPLPGLGVVDPDITEDDNRVSETMMTMWTNFARTGNPSIQGVVDWPAWDEEKDRYLYITEKPEVRSGFSKIGQK